MKLNQLQEQWLAALESGEFEQTTGALQKTKDGKDSYCCLGVACALYEKNGGKLDREKRVNPVEPNNFYHVIENNIGLLPIIVTHYFNFILPAGGDSAHAAYLPDWNDKLKWTFKEIAARIRANPELVFKSNE